jgi:hypothetical protein
LISFENLNEGIWNLKEGNGEMGDSEIEADILSGGRERNSLPQ